MKYLSKRTFLQTSVLFACLIFATVAVQFLISNKLDRKAKEIENLASFITNANNKIRSLELDNLSDTSIASNDASLTILNKQLQEFVEEHIYEFNDKQIEISKDLMLLIEPEKDTEKPLKELITEFVFKVKMANNTLPATIRQLNMAMSGSDYKLTQYKEDLLFYRALSVYAMFALLVVELIGAIIFLKIKYFNPVKKSIQYCDLLSKGIANSQSLPNQSSEIGFLFNRINLANEGIANCTKYLDELVKGNSNVQLEYEEGENFLVKKLHELSRQINMTKQEEEQANWLNVGLAKFGEMLQSQNDDLEQYGDKLISELVKYVGANQGAIFTIEETDSEKQLQLLSTYAWGKKRFGDRKLTMDSGNLVVQAIKEGEYIHLKEIPNDFINITSGLGDANPNAILIVPLIVNDEPLGAIEIATFSFFESHKIDFTLKVCENISTTFSAIANAINTKKLLEHSQAMTEQLRAQEEELRQNAEELEASRENIHRELEIAKKEMQGQVEQIEGEKLKNIAILEGCVDGVIIFKEDGMVDFFNKSAEEIWNISRNDIVGRSISNLLPLEIINDHGVSKIMYTGGGQYKEIEVRTEINTFDQSGNEISLLVTSSQGNVRGAKTYAFFVQTITVELF